MKRGTLIVLALVGIGVWWVYSNRKTHAAKCPSGAYPCTFDATWCCTMDSLGAPSDPLPYLDNGGFG